MNKKMKDKLIVVLRTLINIEKTHKLCEFGAMSDMVNTLEGIAVHESDCSDSLPENMLFGKRGERYMLNAAELTSAAHTLSKVAEEMRTAITINAKPAIDFKEINKARMAVKHCIDR